jgi:hypothetical protein
MTTYESLSVLIALIGGAIALLGLFVSAIALSRTKRLTEQQLRLHAKQEELTDLQLEMLRNEANAKAAGQPKVAVTQSVSFAIADVRVQLRGPASHAKFLIQNWGQGAARNVNVSAVSKANGTSPFLRGDYDQKLPIPELLPGDAVPLLAAITMGSGTTFNVETTWTNPNGQEIKRQQQVSLL